MDEDNYSFEIQAKHLVRKSEDGKSLAILISSVFLRGANEEDLQNTDESITSFWRFFGYWKVFCLDDLVLSLYKIMKSSSEMPIVRTLSFFLLYHLLLTKPFLHLSSHILSELKTTLFFALKEQLSTPIFPVLAKGVSSVFKLSPTTTAWPEYIDYIESLMGHPSEFRKGIWLVIELPLCIPEDVLMPYANKFISKLATYLDMHEDDDDTWGLAFAACFNMMILLDEGDKAKTLMSIVKISVMALMNEGKELVLRKGLHILGFFTFMRVWWYFPNTTRLIVNIVRYILRKECMESETVVAVNRVMDNMEANLKSMKYMMEESEICDSLKMLKLVDEEVDPS